MAGSVEVPSRGILSGWIGGLSAWKMHPYYRNKKARIQDVNE